MQPNPFTEPVPLTEIKDYLDAIKHRLESIDQPLLKMKYTAESINLVKGAVQHQINTLDMYHKNKFLMYKNVFDSIKITISDSFRKLQALH